MEKEGIITGYYAVIDSSKLGLFSIRVYIKYFNTTTENEKEIINYLKENEIIGVIGKIETIYDLVFMVWIKNINEFEKFWIEFKKRLRKT